MAVIFITKSFAIFGKKIFPLEINDYSRENARKKNFFGFSLLTLFVQSHIWKLTHQPEYCR